MKSIRTLLAAIIGLIPVASAALTLEQTPLFIASTEPRVMLVASRDHQLSMKAYTDYSDLDNDGVLDTTYKDSFAYYGYFDSNKCYSYSSGRYEPSGTVTAGTHQCGGSAWSGNFLNWASMTRMDILRKTFYGGYRSVDSTTDTVLERHFLPDDVHAFVKVYAPSGSMPTIQSLTGISGQTSISLCNVSNSSSGTLTGKMGTLPDPKIRVAAGSWPQWDSSEVTQCALSGSSSTQPAAVLNDYNARVKVCVPGSVLVPLEANCKAYEHPTTHAQTVKPTGLLQKYGDVDAERRVRFGLMTGSYAANKSGGVLRKNAALVANNNGTGLNSSSVCGNNNSNDEIDVCTGRFINQGDSQAGIINTLNRLRIAGFNYSTNNHKYSCDSPGIMNFTDGQCVDWGNPLSEIYLESLRYFANVGETGTFDVSDASILDSIPKVSWTDPLPVAEWCAVSSIIVLSTGLNSFDADQLATFTPTGGSTIDAAALTQTVGDASHEGINGGTYLIGDNGSGTPNNQCTEKLVGNLATAKGICPEVPSTQGGYGIAGLAYAPKTIDLRPGYASQRDARWGGTNPINPDWALRQPISTYAVQLAESLPSFSPTVGSGTVTLLPACQANSTGGAAAWTTTSTGWRNCSMTNLIVESNVVMADVGTDSSARTKTCSGNGTSSQCFTVAWEDSTWGNDYDMDGIQRLGYCVGSACSTFKMLCPTTFSATATLGPWASVASNSIVIATCTIQAAAGHALTFGYTLSGTLLADGAYYPILRPGSKNFNVGAKLDAAISAPSAATFSQGVSAAKLLQNPLWYAAKYGGFTESTPTSGTPSPNLQSEWDKVDNTTGLPATSGPCMPGDCVPDSYYDVRNPANLYTAMSNIFDQASLPDAAASSVATNTANLQVDNYIFQAKFQPSNWSGQLVSQRLQIVNNAVTLTQAWDAAPRLDAKLPGSRVILTKGATDGVDFDWASLTLGQQALLNTNHLGVNDSLGSARLDYLRGVDTNEGTGPGQFRERNKTSSDGSILGDIVNSGPLYVGAPNAGYSDIDHPGYSAFRARYLSRKPVVYVGANDGMLHGFDAALDSNGDPVPTGGDEVIAYVPTQVFGSLSRLTAQNYNRNHRYLVDGTSMAADAYLNLASLGANDEDKWRTVLVGNMNSGGKGYFALDITNPNLPGLGYAPTFSAGNATGLLLWEFTDADDSDMGYAYNLPPQYSGNSQAKQIVKMQNGKWAAIVGNGYNSAAGQAVLYVLYIENGVDGSWTSTGDFVKVVAHAGPNNGLSTPVPYDSNGDGKVDVAYAGDLLGNMWRFDLSNPSSPSSSLLFSSGLTKPITTPPEVFSHPSGGNMVLFGTGKYLELSDNANADQQTLYGVRDDNTGTVFASQLQQHNMDATTRLVSPAAIVATPKGWSIDLPASKERMTGIPKLVSGLFFFNTVIPSASACESGGTGWIGALDALTGEQPAYPVFDIDNDGYFDSNDLAAGGIQIGAALGGTTFIKGAPGSSVGVGIASLTTGQLATPPVNFGPLSGGRVNWREILQ